MMIHSVGDVVWRFATARYDVRVIAEPELDEDLSWADDETLEKLDAGEYVNVCWYVTVWGPQGRVGWTSLGNSVYAADELDQFIATGRHRDMVREAIAMARHAISDPEG